MNLAGPSRRAVLVGGGLLAIAGCSSGTRPEPPEPVDPDVAIRAEVTAGVRGLVELYDVVGAAHPALRDEIAPLAAETASHLSALEQPGPTSSSPSSSSGSSTPTATPTPAPQTAAEALAALAAAERTGAESRISQLLRASPALARLVAVIGASEATHATLLRAGG